MSYTVTAPLVIAQDKDGASHHVYQGGVIQWLSPGQKKHFLAEKLVVEGEPSAAESTDGADGPPAKTALKEEWVAWAVKASAGTDEPLTAEQADGEYSKADLIDLFG